MTQLQQIQKYLTNNSGRCDDCIGRELKIDRHTVNKICNDSDAIQRKEEMCKGQCSNRAKLLNSLIATKIASESMPLSKTIIATLKGIFSNENTHSRVKLFAELRISHEGWLKIELLHALSARDKITLLPEKDNIDVVVCRDNPNECCLIELKTFPTNYGGAGKPITNFINSVIRDVKKLKAKQKTAEAGLVVWVAYPIPEGKCEQWDCHLAKVNKEAGPPICHQKVDLGGCCYAHMYVHQAFSEVDINDGVRIAGN